MKRRFLIALTVTVATSGALASAVYAYWRTSGSGSGTASVGTASNVTLLAASGTPTSLLSPGGSADLLVTLNNPNSYAVTIVGAAQNGTVTAVGGSGCTTSGVSVPTQSGLTISVASGTHTVTISNGALMSSSSDSGCQGASFQIPVTLTVQR